MRTTTASALLLALTLAAGCAHAPPKKVGPPPPPPGLEVKPYFPLAVGNRWHYHGTMLGQTVDHTITIVAHDGRWWRDNAGPRYQLDALGLRSPKRYLLRAPLARGTHWKAVVSVASTEYYEVSAAGIPARVPAGAFQGCVRVTARNRHDARTTLFVAQTYCPDVGLVRVRTWMDVAGKGEIPQAELDLVSYSVKGEHG